MIIVFAILSFGVQRFVIYPSYLSLEYESALDDMERCIRSLDREIYHVDRLSADWASWDDTYKFALDRNAEYIKSNLQDETYYSTSINLIYIVNLEDEVLWGKIMDLDKKEELTLPEFPKERWSPSHPLLQHKKEESNISGVLLTKYTPILISSKPILTSENKGPIRGTIIMGRFLNDKIVNTLAEQTRVNFQSWPITTKEGSGKFQSFSKKLKPGEKFVQVERKSNTLEVYTTFPDINGNPALLILANVPRKISEKGRAAIPYAFFSTLSAGLAVLLVLSTFLRKTVIEPITSLSQYVSVIEKSGDLSKRLNLKRIDEIGILAGKFDSMLERLENDTHKREQLEEELLQISLTDALTGIANRRVFDELMEKEWRRCMRSGSPLSLALIDIDYFKLFNDNYGHQAGDDCIRNVANALVTSVRRASDFVARYGGDEFIVIMPETDINGAGYVGENIRKTVEALKTSHQYSRISQFVTISVGVSSVVPNKNISTKDLIKKADEALYKAKKLGCNQTCIVGESNP